MLDHTTAMLYTQARDRGGTSQPTSRQRRQQQARTLTRSRTGRLHHGHHLVARWGNGRTIVLGSFGIALSMLPLALIPHWEAAGLGFMGVATLFSMTTAPLRVYSQEIVSSDWRPAMSGALMMGAGLSGSAMTYAGGYLITTLGYPGLFLIGAGLTVAGALFFWAHVRAPHRDSARPTTLAQVE